MNSRVSNVFKIISYIYQKGGEISNVYRAAMHLDMTPSHFYNILKFLEKKKIIRRNYRTSSSAPILVITLNDNKYGKLCFDFINESKKRGVLNENRK